LIFSVAEVQCRCFSVGAFRSENADFHFFSFKQSIIQTIKSYLRRVKKRKVTNYNEWVTS
jgi:hypothetical protein